MKTILVLCHGNTHRSPACEAVLKELLPPIYEVRSAGFTLHQNRRAAAKMRDAMKERGYDLEKHRSQFVTRELVDWADEVIVMDSGNESRFMTRFPDAARKMVNLGTVVGQKRVPDPAFLRKNDPKFLAIVDLVVKASEAYARSKS